MITSNTPDLHSTKEVWLLDSFFSKYPPQRGGWYNTDIQKWKSQYEIWQHADSLLLKTANDHELFCAIAQLNRAIEFRDNLLVELYNLKKIPGFQKLENKHEIMEELGIIKQVMKAKLNDIRNKTMHSADYESPTLNVCKELSEFTWYYLRSTDTLVAQPSTEIKANDGLDEQEEWAEIAVCTKSWKINIRGKFSKHSLSFTQNPDNYCGKITIDFIKPPDNQGLYYLSGVIHPPGLTQKFIKAYFAAI